jgi:hypothetical protein
MPPTLNPSAQALVADFLGVLFLPKGGRPALAPRVPFPRRHPSGDAGGGAPRMSPPEPLGALQEFWLGHVVWWDAALGLVRVSGAADERFGSFPFA